MKNVIRIVPLLIAFLFISCNKEVEPDNNQIFPIVYYNLQTDDWEYLIRNEAEQLLIYKESDTDIVAFGINNPYDSIGYFFYSNDSVVSITSDALDFYLVMREDSVLVIVNEGETSHFYKYASDSVFNSNDLKSCRLDNCDVLSALFSQIVSLNPYTRVIMGFINAVGTLRELDGANIYQLIDWWENGNHDYNNIFRWAKRKEYEHNSNPFIIAGISTGGNRVEGTTAYCLVDGYIKLQADIYYTGTLSANYGVCYSTSLNPTIQDSKQEMSISIGDGTISQTAKLPHAFCISGLEESTTYYYRAFYEIGAIDELVYGEIKQFTTEGLFEINTMASPSEGGTVTGGGRYPANTTITLTASANNGFEFTHWEDGSVLNVRTITVEGDATYTAYFEEQQLSIPDLSGTWTFNQTYFGEHHLQLNMQFQSSTATSATYTSGWGVNSISLTAYIDGSMSIGCYSPYGYTGSFSGTFNTSFTIASGDSYYYGTGSWANPGWIVEDPWTFTR